MILEYIAVIIFALAIDLTLGDPKNRYHPTAWMGSLIAKLTRALKNSSSFFEKIGGIFVMSISSAVVIFILVSLHFGINLITPNYLEVIVFVIIASILLKTTIAIKGMERHATDIVNSLEKNDIDSAREKLSMIVKRKTSDLDKNHIYSGIVESVSENTVDGITGPLFYFGIFGLPGAFIYRLVNTADSMLGYKTEIFRNIGWFAANSDKVLNFLPSRITAIIMIFSAMILGNNWKGSFKIMMRDGKKTLSPNAGYPMAAIAGALETKFEKIGHYSLGDGEVSFDKEHVTSAIRLMKITSILFSVMIVIPIIFALSFLGWWIYA
jgi:adenosylcobinamide-phosphate synthase